MDDQQQIWVWKHSLKLFPTHRIAIKTNNLLLLEELQENIIEDYVPPEDDPKAFEEFPDSEYSLDRITMHNLDT